MISILITGAASGIGAATAKKLASKEVSLTLTTKTNLEGLKSVKQFAENKGAKVSYVCVDLSKKKFLEAVTCFFGKMYSDPLCCPTFFYRCMSAV